MPPPIPHLAIDTRRGLLETMLTIDGNIIALTRHLRRARHSVTALFGHRPLPTEASLQAAAATVPGRGCLRLTLVPSGAGLEASTTCEPLALPTGVRLDLVPIAAPGGLGPHKWRDRSWIDAAVASTGRAIPVFVDGDDILETSRASLFVVLNGAVITPPLDGRILPGIGRERAIELLRSSGQAVYEQRVTTDDLAPATEVFAVNSIRGVEVVGTCQGIGSWNGGPVCSHTAQAIEADNSAAVTHGRP